jgi:hypothetical protein
MSSMTSWSSLSTASSMRSGASRQSSQQQGRKLKDERYMRHGGVRQRQQGGPGGQHGGSGNRRGPSAPYPYQQHY